MTMQVCAIYFHNGEFHKHETEMNVCETFKDTSYIIANFLNIEQSSIIAIVFGERIHVQVPEEGE